MPLETPYGVVSGTIARFDLVAPSGGKWPHYHVWIDTPSGQYDSAINLKSLTQVRIEYRVRVVDRASFTHVLALLGGWTPLAQTGGSGAWDYVRSPPLAGAADWTLQSGENLIHALEALLAGCTRIHVFGAAYDDGLGVHDVHMNQGDPAGSEFAQLDAIWQDGGVLFEYGPSAQPKALQIKFETQSLHTDDEGRPLPALRLPPRYVPIWRWPPDEPPDVPWKDLLTDEDLFDLASLARVGPRLVPEARELAESALRAELAARLPDIAAGDLERMEGFLRRLGRQL